MARKPSKARVEGAAARKTVRAVPKPVISEDIAVQCIVASDDDVLEAMAAAEAKVPGAIERLPNPVPGDDGEALERITAYFKAKFPDEWNEWMNCPLQYGIEAMAGKLKGQG